MARIGDFVVEEMYRKATAVTPNDSTDLAIQTAALWIGGAGTVALTMADGNNATFTFPAGTKINLQVKRVLATGTTATGIIALNH